MFYTNIRTVNKFEKKFLHHRRSDEDVPRAGFLVCWSQFCNFDVVLVILTEPKGPVGQRLTESIQNEEVHLLARWGRELLLRYSTASCTQFETMGTMATAKSMNNADDQREWEFEQHLTGSMPRWKDWAAAPRLLNCFHITDIKYRSHHGVGMNAFEPMQAYCRRLNVQPTVPRYKIHTMLIIINCRTLGKSLLGYKSPTRSKFLHLCCQSRMWTGVPEVSSISSASIRSANW